MQHLRDIPRQYLLDVPEQYIYVYVRVADPDPVGSGMFCPDPTNAKTGEEEGRKI